MEQYSKYILNKLIKVGQNPDGVFYIKEKRLSDEHRNNILTEGQNLGYNEVYINEIINQLIVYNPSQEDLKMIFENSDVEFIKYSDDKKKFQVRGKYIGTYLGDIVGSEKAENYKWEEAKEYIKFTDDKLVFLKTGKFIGTYFGNETGSHEVKNYDWEAASEFVKYSDNKNAFVDKGKYVGYYYGNKNGSTKPSNYRWEKAIKYVRYSNDCEHFSEKGRYIGTYWGNDIGSEKASNYQWEEVKEYIKFTDDKQTLKEIGKYKGLYYGNEEGSVDPMNYKWEEVKDSLRYFEKYSNDKITFSQKGKFIGRFFGDEKGSFISSNYKWELSRKYVRYSNDKQSFRNIGLYRGTYVGDNQGALFASNYKWRSLLPILLLFAIGLGIFLYLIFQNGGVKNKFYKDADGDGYGIIIDSVFAKNTPSGYVSNHNDNDDNNPCIPDSTTTPCLTIKVPKKSCPTLNKNFGDPCDDNDPSTFDDRIDSSCTCKGQSGTITWYEDKDGDGIGNENKTKVSNNNLPGYVTIFGDCNDNEKNIRRIGDPCSDNDPKTDNDSVGSDCVCRGIPKVTKDRDFDGISDITDKCPDLSGKKEWEGCPDTDNDGIPDHKDICPNQKGIKNGCPDEADTDQDGFIDSSDACPRRPGPQSNKGCPTIEIQDLHNEIYVDEDFDVEIKAYDALPGDNIYWAISKGTVLLQGQNKTNLRPSEPGLTTIQVGVNNPTDGFKDTDSEVICIQYRKETLEKWINDKLKVIGNYSPNNNVPSSQKREADMFRQKLLDVASPDIQIIENGNRWGGNLGAFIDAKFLTRGSFVKQVSISTPQSQLFNKSTGKIDKISFIITR